MTRLTTIHKCIVAAVFGAVLAGAPALAQSGDLTELFDELARPDNDAWQRTEADILREWSKSGSPTMDLLLKRGEEATQAGDYAAAIDHLTALTDHAPDFAEGWNARATAYFYAGYLGPSMADIATTLSLNPRHFGALAGLGMIYEQLGRTEEALRAFRAALAIHPHQPNIAEAVQRLERQIEGTAL